MQCDTHDAIKCACEGTGDNADGAGPDGKQQVTAGAAAAAAAIFCQMSLRCSQMEGSHHCASLGRTCDCRRRPATTSRAGHTSGTWPASRMPPGAK